MTLKTKEVYRFDGFRLDVAAHSLTHLGETIKLTPKRFKLLLLLVRNSGVVLEKKKIIREVWPDVVIADNDFDNQSIYSQLNNCVSNVRTALKDDRKQSRMIETLSGIGYRFMADVEKIEESLALPTIAVLPFKQLNVQQPSDQFLGLGMAFTIITKIRNIGGIVVRPASSISKYDTPDQDPLSSAIELDADYLVNGYIQRIGQMIRVNAEFLRLQDNVALCSETYDEKYSELLNIQDLIAERMAQEVGREIGQKLTSKERKGLNKSSTSSTDAYLHYVEGRFYWNKFTREAHAKAITCFERAIEIDPTYARAYSGKSDVYTWLGIYNLMPPKDAFPKARENALIALDHDEDLASAHTSLAFVDIFNEWNWQAAEDRFKLAIELNPNYTTSHLGYSLLLTGRGRFVEAIEESNKALEVDPVSRILTVVRGITLFEARRYDESMENFERALELDPTFDAGYFGSALAYSHRKKYAKAVEAAKKAYEISHANPINLSLLSQIYGMWRKKTEAQKILDNLDKLCQRRYISPFHMACVNVSLARPSIAFKCLRKAVEVRDPWVILLNVDPRFDSIRHHSWFTELLAEIGLAG
jgi:serine/threonine-protein kinase